MLDEIPKTIWMYWEQGWDRAPQLVRQCAESWRRHNPDWQLRTLDKQTLLEFFDIEQWAPGEPLAPAWLTPVRKWIHRSLHSTELIKKNKIKIQQRSDIIRVNLLERYGGVWADATLFCTRPLDSWLASHTTQGFFAFSNPGERLLLRDGSLPLWLSYFLVATPDHHIVKTLNTATFEYFRDNDNPSEYYLFIFDLFNQCYRNDACFAAQWDAVRKIDAPIPAAGEFDKSGGVEFFAWQTSAQLNDLSDEYKTMLRESPAPAFKLSNKKHYCPTRATRIRYLFATMPPQQKDE